MSLTSIWENLQSRFHRRRLAGSRQRSASCHLQPRLEPLESRLALATFFVTTNQDGDPVAPAVGTLRAAIMQANQTPNVNGPDMIQSMLPIGSQTISVFAPLPSITDTVTIEGLSPVSNGLMTIDGTSAGSVTGPFDPGVHGLLINADGCTV